MTESGVIDKVALVYGQMNEPPGARLRVGLSGLTMAEYFRDQGQDVLLFIDNIFRFVQAGSEVSALLGRMPSAVGYQPTLATEMGQLQERITSTRNGLGHVRAGDLRAGRRPHRPGAGEHVRPPRRHDRALARDRRAGHLPGRRPARLDVARAPAGHRLATSTTASRRRCSRCSSATRTCRTSSRSSAWTSSPTRTSVIVQRARKIQRFLSQPYFVAEQFTGTPGEYVQAGGHDPRASTRSSRASTTSCPSRRSTWSARSSRRSPKHKGEPVAATVAERRKFDVSLVTPEGTAFEGEARDGGRPRRGGRDRRAGAARAARRAR